MALHGCCVGHGAAIVGRRREIGSGLPPRRKGIGALGSFGGGHFCRSSTLMLGGSWHLVTNYFCTSNCTDNHIMALKGLIIRLISGLEAQF